MDLLEGEIRSSEETLADVQQKIDKLDGELKGSEIPELNKKADAAQSEIKRLQERLTGIDAEILKDKIREESGQREAGGACGQKRVTGRPEGRGLAAQRMRPPR